MAAKLTSEQIDKLKKNWVHKKGDFDLLAVEGTEEYREDLVEFRDRQLEHWRLDELMATHTPERCYLEKNGDRGQTISRIRTNEGWLYMRTVWASNAIDGSMCFVPDFSAKVGSSGPLARLGATDNHGEAGSSSELY